MLSQAEMQILIQSYLRMLEDAERVYDYMIENGKSQEEAYAAMMELKTAARKAFNDRTR